MSEESSLVIVFLDWKYLFDLVESQRFDECVSLQFEFQPRKTPFFLLQFLYLIYFDELSFISW